MILRTSPTDGHDNVRSQCGILLLFVLGLTVTPHIGAATVNVDCNAGGAVGPILNRLKTGDVVLVQGTCQENILIQAQLQGITLDGQRKATIKAPDPGQPAIQVLGREITIKGFTVIGGSFGIAINRGILSTEISCTGFAWWATRGSISPTPPCACSSSRIPRRHRTGCLVSDARSAPMSKALSGVLWGVVV